MGRDKKQKNLLIGLTCLVFLMFGFGFALVPIYNTLCKTLGINGKINLESSKAANTAVSDREVLVEFVATNNGGVPWAFYPKVKKIRLHPGKMSQLAFYAENRSDHRMVVQAIPSVTPAIAAKYVKKTECFCFRQQTLEAHEAMDMPLLFHLDSDLPVQIKTVTLAYTLFDVTERAQGEK